MVKRVLWILALFIFLSGADVFSQGNFIQSRKDMFIEFGMNYLSGSNYYNINGDEKSQFKEIRTIGDKIDTNYYVTEFKDYRLALALNYRLMKNLFVRTEVPFSYLTSKESNKVNYLKDTQTFTDKTRGQFSYFEALHYGFSAGYNFLDSGIFRPSARLGFKIPTKFKNGIQNALSDSILRYDCFELSVGADLTLNFKTSWLGIGATYNLRDIVLKDQAVIHLEGGFTTVPQTYLKAWTNIVLSAAQFNNTLEINTRRIGYQENYTDVGFAFFLQIDRDIFTSVSYSLKFSGKNSWMLGNIGFQAGFYL